LFTEHGALALLLPLPLPSDKCAATQLRTRSSPAGIDKLVAPHACHRIRHGHGAMHGVVCCVLSMSSTFRCVIVIARKKKTFKPEWRAAQLARLTRN
jgi:hypothetical protein